MVPSVNSSLPEGWNIPERIFFATSRSLLVGVLMRTAVPDQASRQTTIKAARSCQSHVFGAEA